ncbi:MAG TPA: hypothetical protein VIH99_07425, partial [Bdellovibrionota bacterium]
MRRLLRLLLLLVVVLPLSGVVTVYFFRDQILLEQIRKRSGLLAPAKLEIGSLESRLLGGVSLVLKDVQFVNGGIQARIREARLSSPLNAFALYQAYNAKQEIPLSIALVTPVVTLPLPPPGKGGTPSSPTAWPPTIVLPLASPLPLRAELSVLNGELHGPYEARDLEWKATLRGNPSGLEGETQLKAQLGGAGTDTRLPISLETKFAGTPRALKLQTLGLRAAGIEGSGSGELTLEPLAGKFRLGMEVPDLSRLSLRPEEKSALGLTAQPAGSFSLKLYGTLNAKGLVDGSGQLKLQNAVLPLNLPERTAFSKLAEGHHLEGNLLAQVDLPFQLKLDVSSANAPVITVSKASVGMDLTNAALASKGMLEKPKGIPLRASFQGGSDEKGVRVESLSATFHTLTLRGSGSVPLPLGKSVDASFELRVPSLDGFPALLPMLRQGEGAALAQAKGSIEAVGKAHYLLQQPSFSIVSLDSLWVRNLQLPLAYTGASASAKGVLTGTISGKGKYAAGDLNITQSNGFLDFTALDLAIPGKLAKPRGRKLEIAFDAKGNASRLQINNLQLKAQGLFAHVRGSAAFNAKRNATVQLKALIKAELEPLREYLPKDMPAKISGGNFSADLALGGSWIPEGGLEKSPLSVSGQLEGKLASVVMPEAAAAVAKSATPPKALLPDWPLARNAKVGMRFNIGQFQRGSLVMNGISTTGSLSQGKFVVNGSVAELFGGKASLTALQGSLLDPKLALSGKGGVDGLDLSQAAAFVDKSYGEIVKGSLKASSTFSVPDFWSDSLMNSASGAGEATVHNGYLSTASFDALVNEKLKGIPGLGEKANVKTGGVSSEIQTAFQFANGKAVFQKFTAVTPQKDEMILKGTIGLDFNADLSGEAHLTNAPVRGAVR